MGAPEGFVYPDAIVSTGGHVDHGKTTVVYALSGQWVARHSEEVKRAMTIKLGYTQIGLYECGGDVYGGVVSDGLLTSEGKCPDGSEPKLLRRVSILDVPGHEVLIATMVAGASAVDAAMLVVDASMPVPQPQTEEHFMVFDIIGVKHMVVVQNKIDLVPRDKAVENYKQIRRFLAGTWAEKSVVIPVSALHRVNIDALAYFLHRSIPRPDRELGAPARMLVLRSFNVNRPGTPPEKLVGGVIGGVLLRGTIRVGDEVEIRPGIRLEQKGAVVYKPLMTKVVSIQYSGVSVPEARPGGLVAMGTTLDPALTKADALVGAVAGKPGTLPPVWTSIEVSVRELPRVSQEPFKQKEMVMVAVGSATVFGVVESVKKNVINVGLRKAVSADQGSRVVIIRQIKGAWKVYGWGLLEGGKVVLE